MLRGFALSWLDSLQAAGQRKRVALSTSLKTLSTVATPAGRRLGVFWLHALPTLRLQALSGHVGATPSKGKAALQWLCPGHGFHGLQASPQPLPNGYGLHSARFPNEHGVRPSTRPKLRPRSRMQWLRLGLGQWRRRLLLPCQRLAGAPVRGGLCHCQPAFLAFALCFVLL